MARLIELQATFPRITKTIWPFAGIAIFFVPDKFFCPKPALLAKCQNQFKNKCMTFAIFRFFFDVQNESSGWLEHAKKLFAARQKPFHIFVRRNSAVSIFTFVGIRWGRDNQIKRIIRIVDQDIQTIAVFDFCCEDFHVNELSLMNRRTQVVFRNSHFNFLRT